MSKENLEKAVGKEVKITLLTTSGNIKFSGVLNKLNYPMSLTLDEEGADYMIPLIGIGGGVKSVHSDNKEIYSNPLLNGKYPRGLGISGEGLKKLHEFRKTCFGADYKF